MRFVKGKTPYVLVISFAVLTLALFIARTNPTYLQPIRNLVFDSYQQIKPRVTGDSAVIIVDIDEKSLQSIGQWPWPRNEMGELIEKITKSGALAIAFDMVFSEKDRTSLDAILKDLEQTANLTPELETLLSSAKSNDENFAQKIKTAPVVMGFFDTSTEPKGIAQKKAGISWLGADLSHRLQNFNGAIASLKELQDGAIGSGSMSLGADQTDDIVRTVPLFSNNMDRVFPSLSIEALRIAIQNASQQLQSFTIKTTLSGTEGGSSDAITSARVASFDFPLSETGNFRVYYSKPDPNIRISATDIFDKNPQNLSEFIEGKIVLIGTSAVGLRDIRVTTLRDQIPGVAIHAQIINQIMEAKFLNRPDWAPGFEWVLTAIVTILILLVLPIIGPLAAAFFGGAIALTILGSSWFAFDKYGLLIDPTVPMFMGLLSYGLTTILLFAFADREKRFIRDAFKHYLSPDLVEKLENSPEELKLGGEIKEMTLMFIDVRNFTKISEKLEPQELVQFLNDLLSPLSEIIQDNEGAIDKYIGDSIMAFWNAPLDVDNHAEKASCAALKILQKLEEMNNADVFGFEKLELKKVEIGIGINTGQGCVGNMGSKSRFDYSVIGDSVNVAARLESASKEVKWPILVSQYTCEQCPNMAFLEAGYLELKGKSEPQLTYALVGDDALNDSKEFQDLKDANTNYRNAIIKDDQAIIHQQRKNCLNLSNPALHPFFEKTSH